MTPLTKVPLVIRHLAHLQEQRKVEVDPHGHGTEERVYLCSDERGTYYRLALARAPFNANIIDGYFSPAFCARFNAPLQGADSNPDWFVEAAATARKVVRQEYKRYWANPKQVDAAAAGRSAPQLMVYEVSEQTPFEQALDKLMAQAGQAPKPERHYDSQESSTAPKQETWRDRPPLL